METRSLSPREKTVFELRELYEKYGYSHYKMGKFEEYDLYARHKDFLISDEIITFTDTNGKLMALKPDVTLSIVKNNKEDQNSVQKLYYNENVYRVEKGTRTFRELMQIGLEAFGQVDAYTVFEVLKLAAESLGSLQRNCVLEISHIGILSQMLDHMGIPEKEKLDAIHLIGEKNLHEMIVLCKNQNIPEEEIKVLEQLVGIYGTPSKTLPEIISLISGRINQETLDEFVMIIKTLEAEKDLGDIIRLDFSALDDPGYYNDFVFKGFVEGIPTSVLSGGQYDTLMKKMKKKSRAIGFAVYLDLLEQLDKTHREYDVDTVIIYDENEVLSHVSRLANKLRDEGETVFVQRHVPARLRFKKALKLANGEVKELENYA